MVMFQPKILNPTPDRHWVRELARLDPDLRLVWGYQRYLTSKWVVERRIDPERYFQMYGNLLEADMPRFVSQPIIDHDRPLYDDEGVITGYETVGQREYDLAPEFEYVLTAQNRDGSYRAFGEEDMLELRRWYAWNRNHPLSRAKFEEEERLLTEAKERAEANKLAAMIDEGIDEAFHETGFRKRYVLDAGERESAGITGGLV